METQIPLPYWCRTLCSGLSLLVVCGLVCFKSRCLYSRTESLILFQLPHFHPWFYLDVRNSTISSCNTTCFYACFTSQTLGVCSVFPSAPFQLMTGFVIFRDGAVRALPHKHRSGLCCTFPSTPFCLHALLYSPLFLHAFFASQISEFSVSRTLSCHMT